MIALSVLNEIGCFIDTGARDLEGPYVSTSDMTPENCVMFCQNNNYRYAGTQVRHLESSTPHRTVPESVAVAGHQQMVA